MHAQRTITVRLVTTGITFLTVALASIAATIWMSWQLEGGAAAVNEAGRLRMLSYRIALAEATHRNADIDAAAASFDATLRLLHDGDPARPLFMPDDAAAQTAFAAVSTRWAGWKQRLQASPRGAAGTGANDGVAAAQVAGIEGLVHAMEQSLAQWTSILRATQLTMVALTIGSALLLFYAGHRMILEPLLRLGRGLSGIRNGVFTERVDVVSNDEFGELAQTFNDMAERLASLYGQLEARVQEKTEHLEVKRERLAALYEVSRFAAQADDLETLASGIVQRVRTIARADAAAIRWTDERTRRFLMLAHEGLPSSLVDAEQCLDEASCACGQVVADPSARVIPIRSLNAALGHCERAGFQNLIAVPVRSQQRVLGEITLFYRHAIPLDDEGRAVLETVAGDLAAGIESMRATALEREASIAQERSLLARELHDSIAQTLAFLKIQAGLAKTAFDRDDAPGARLALAEIDSGVRECYGDVRELLLHFRTRTDDEDILVALRATLQKFEHQSGVAAELSVEGHGVPLPADVQLQVLHMVQEALSNIRKHASANQVRLRVQQVPDWRIEIEDDGCGFDPAMATGEAHVGLKIMRERGQRCGATFGIRSTPGAGTVVAIAVARASTSAPRERVHADSAAGR